MNNYIINARASNSWLSSDEVCIQWSTYLQHEQDSAIQQQYYSLKKLNFKNLSVQKFKEKRHNYTVTLMKDERQSILLAKTSIKAKCS